MYAFLYYEFLSSQGTKHGHIFCFSGISHDTPHLLEIPLRPFFPIEGRSEEGLFTQYPESFKFTSLNSGDFSYLPIHYFTRDPPDKSGNIKSWSPQREVVGDLGFLSRKFFGSGNNFSPSFQHPTLIPRAVGWESMTFECHTMFHCSFLMVDDVYLT